MPAMPHMARLYALGERRKAERDGDHSEKYRHGRQPMAFECNQRQQRQFLARETCILGLAVEMPPGEREYRCDHQGKEHPAVYNMVKPASAFDPYELRK